jgi:hypothetical protein
MDNKAKGFFKERKHYTLHMISAELGEKDEETKRLVGILKKYGVVKAVKRSKPEFSDLSNEDIILADVIENSYDIEYIFDYVGVVMLEGHVFKCYPKYINSKTEPIDELKRVLKVIKKYNSSEQLIHLFNGEDENRIFNKLAVSLHLLEEYFSYGLYTNQQEAIEVNGEGEILWDKTINETFAIIKNNRPYYLELQTSKVVDNDFDYFRRLHECVLSMCSRELDSVGLLDIFEIANVELTDVDLDGFGSKDYILYRLQSEIQTQFITRKQNLLKTLYAYIANAMVDKEDISYSLYGTNCFNIVWERICAENFVSVLDKPITELPLTIEEDYGKEVTLRSMIDCPHWYGFCPVADDSDVGTLKPDMISIYPVDESKNEYCFGIYDAKYYCIEFKQERGKWKVIGQPGVGDVTKQYLYQLAYDGFIRSHGYKYVQNMFLCPSESENSIYGYVEMEMLNNIGNIKLENISVVKLSADEMFDIYLSNGKINDFKKYFNTEYSRVIENKSFSNRMMSYWRGADDIKSVSEAMDKNNGAKTPIDYPEQLRMEISARLIYEVFCDIVNKNDYSFNPYENSKVNVGTDGILDIYGKHNQLADAALEFDKMIKILPEDSLKEESKIKNELKKCFKDKDELTFESNETFWNMLTKSIMEFIEKYL